MDRPITPWKTLSSRIVHESRWLTLYEDEVVAPNGEHRTYTYIKSPPFVLVVGYDGAHFIMIHQHRYNSNELVSEFPGGSIELDETPIDAAQREFQEETGLVAERWTMLGTIHNPNHATIFLAEGLTDSGRHKMEEDGIKRHVCLTSSEIVALAHQNQLTDSKTLAALYLFEHRVKREDL